jgi:chemotaxis protein histidine kinase CheA
MLTFRAQFHPMDHTQSLTAVARQGADVLIASLDKERAAIEAFVTELCAAANGEREAAETAHRATAEQLADAQKRIDETTAQLDASRQQADDSRARLDEARHQIDDARRQLEEAHQQFAAAEAQAAERARHAQAEARRAQEDIESARESHASLLTQLEEARDASAASDLLARERAAALDRVAAALRAMRAAVSSKDILDVVLDTLNAHFERVAILIAGTGGLKCWLHRGFEGEASVDGLIVGFEARSPAILALQTREVIEIERTEAAPITGLDGGSIARALALPMVAADRTIAVAYTESRAMPTPEDFEIGRRVAEILVEFASRRVNAKRPQVEGAQSQPSDGVYSTPRQARRIRMRDAVNILLDGSASFLIDLSTRGAQVLSPASLRPTQAVRIMLVVGDRTIECAGRCVWALFEQAKGSSGALYRAGVEFIEVDTPAVEAFLAGMSTARRDLVAR